MSTLGRLQMAILRKCAGGARFECSTENQYMSALKLSQRGLLDRDVSRGGSHRFFGNQKGDAVVSAGQAESRL